MKLKVFIFSALLLPVACCLSPLSARTIEVKEGESIQAALNQAQSGDVVKVADGTYYEALTVAKGVTLEGSGNTVLCGLKSEGKRGIYNNGTVRWLTIEFFTTNEQGGGIFNNAGVVEYCTIRGCRGHEAMIYTEADGIVRNCLLHNNQPSRDGWPNSGGFYNPQGEVYNCTSARNFGHYTGWHSESRIYNCVSWGHERELGFSDKTAYISSGAAAYGAGNNAADLGSSSFFKVRLNAGNYHTKGPHFIDPTPFAGAPTTEDEREAVRLADFRLAYNSPLINKGTTVEGVPEVDLLGLARPQKDTMDIGAYEYNPNEGTIKPISVRLLRDTLRIHVGETGLLVKEILPHNATNKQCRWVSSKNCVSVDNGIVTGNKEGISTITVQTISGRYSATAVVIVEPEIIPYVCPEVLDADAKYHIEDYTIPSYVPMWVAKEQARLDSSKERLDTLQMRINELVGKEEPYCVVTNINGDPTTQMAFNWFTNEGIKEGKIQLVAKADATEADFAGEVIEVEAEPTTTKPLRYAVSTSGLIKTLNIPVTQAYTYVAHKVIVTNLTPGTTYSYRVGYAGHWSDIRSFRTEEEEQGDFSFLYMSDSHLMNREYVEAAQMCANVAAKNEPDARFLCFPGDFVETGDAGNSEWEWERWFEQSLRPVISKMPVAPTDGNHDDSPNLNYNYHFNTDYQFNLQTKIKPQFKGITYSFQYGDVLFLVYSKQDYWRGSYSESKRTCDYLTNDVGNWFKEQVAAHPTAKWRVALVHFNVFSGSGHQDDEATAMFRATMLPIFKELEIDVVMQGHDHCYEIIGPVNPDTKTPILSAISDVETVAQDNERNMTGKKGGTFCVDDGTLYFIGATCGAKRYSPNSREEMEALKYSTDVKNYFDLFTGMFGQPGAPSYTRVDASADGLTFHSFTTDKQGNSTEFNQFKVVRTKEHSEYIYTDLKELNSRRWRTSVMPDKILYDGNIYITKDKFVFSLLGERIQ